jgi:group I intron endonuclease
MVNKWILYKTTNLVNGKVYIGVHKLANTSKSKKYLGSGKTIKAAIEKYGRANFTRDTLAEFSCAEDVYKAEAEIVTLAFCNRIDTYNIKTGGEGGRGVILPNETKAKMSAARKGKVLSEQHKINLSISKKGNQYGLGHKVSEEHKNILRASKIGGKNPASKAILINDDYYESATTAAKAKGVSAYVILYRVKSTDSKYEGYSFAPIEGQAEQYPPQEGAPQG